MRHMPTGGTYYLTVGVSAPSEDQIVERMRHSGQSARLGLRLVWNWPARKMMSAQTHGRLELEV